MSFKTVHNFEQSFFLPERTRGTRQAKLRQSFKAKKSPTNLFKLILACTYSTFANASEHNPSLLVN